jgi:hypothetical protein
MWRRLTLDDRIIFFSGLALFVDSFAPWYWTDVGGPAVSRTAWRGPGLPFALLAVALGLGLAALVVVRARSAGSDHPFAPDRAALVHLVGGAVAFLAVVLRMKAGRDEATWGVYLGLVLSGGLLLGGLGLWKAAGLWWPSVPGSTPSAAPADRERSEGRSPHR